MDLRVSSLTCLEDSCHGQITVSCRSRVESFKPIVRVGFYRLPRRRVIRCQKSLEGREDPRGMSEHFIVARRREIWLSGSNRALRSPEGGSRGKETKRLNSTGERA